MVETDVRDIFAKIYNEILGLACNSEADNFEQTMDALRGLDLAVDTAGFSDIHRAHLRFMLSSAMINVASDVGNDAGLATGIAWASRLADDAATPADLVPQARLNLANGLLEIATLKEARHTGTDATDPDYRLANIDELRPVRTLLEAVGHDLSVPVDARSRALCNLGNMLDESGRWVEAYEAYSDALDADPTNGNAAGNMAELLRRRLSRHTGQRGHLAAVYNHYVRMAQSLEDRTIEIAGPAVAERWKRLQFAETEGHFSHDGDPLSPYQQWIVANRLALVDAVEGLGSDSDRWDSATVSNVVTPIDASSVPAIYAAFNVLKAEFLVARRLAFRGFTMIDESQFQQHPDDTGLYSDTLDGGFYGEGPALLLLAQRSALDVLDKIAVTANEHFKSGMTPSKVDFIKYWIDPKTRDVRPALASGDPGRRSILALAELATDTEAEKCGMYVPARLLRNAGTHRLVHVTSGVPTGPTKETFSSVDVDELALATVTALWVVRAAYLYLVDLVESQRGTGKYPPVMVPNQR